MRGSGRDEESRLKQKSVRGGLSQNSSQIRLKCSILKCLESLMQVPKLRISNIFRKKLPWQQIEQQVGLTLQLQTTEGLLMLFIYLYQPESLTLEVTDSVSVIILNPFIMGRETVSSSKDKLK